MTRYYCDRCGAQVKNRAALIGIESVKFDFLSEGERAVLGEVCNRCLIYLHEVVQHGGNKTES